MTTLHFDEATMMLFAEAAARLADLDELLAGSGDPLLAEERVALEQALGRTLLDLLDGDRPGGVDPTGPTGSGALQTPAPVYRMGSPADKRAIAADVLFQPLIRDGKVVAWLAPGREKFRVFQILNAGADAHAHYQERIKTLEATIDEERGWYHTLLEEHMELLVEAGLLEGGGDAPGPRVSDDDLDNPEMLPDYIRAEVFCDVS